MLAALLVGSCFEVPPFAGDDVVLLPHYTADASTADPGPPTPDSGLPEDAPLTGRDRPEAGFDRAGSHIVMPPVPGGPMLDASLTR